MKKTPAIIVLILSSIISLFSEEVEIVNPRFKYDKNDRPITKKLVDITQLKGWSASHYERFRVILEINSEEDPNPDKNSVVLNKGMSIQQTLSHTIESNCLYLFYIDARWFGGEDEIEGEVILSFFYIDENETEKEIATNALSIRSIRNSNYSVSFSTTSTDEYLGKPLGIKITAPKPWVQIFGVSVEKKRE